MAEVKIYSTPTCPYCKKVKDYLVEKNIVFQDCDVSKDRSALDDMVKNTGQMGVPVVMIDGSAIVGFDKPKIDQALGLS